MRAMIYWLLGSETGRTVVGSWQWAWRIHLGWTPRQIRAALAHRKVDIAAETLLSIQEIVRKLEKTVKSQEEAFQKIYKNFEAKVCEITFYEPQAFPVNDDSDPLAQIKYSQLKQLIPQLEGQMKQAKHYVQVARERLAQEQLRLHEHQSNMQYMKDLSEVNQTIAQMEQMNKSTFVYSASSQFETVKGSFERQIEQQQIYQDFALSLTDGIYTSELDQQ